MAVRIDSNGKVFTDQIRKQKVTCVIQTITQRIRGHIFKDPDARTKDDLNVASESFIAISSAEILDAHDQVMQTAPFLIVNKQHVVWLLPDDSEFVSRNDDGAGADDDQL